MKFYVELSIIKRCLRNFTYVEIKLDCGQTMKDSDKFVCCCYQLVTRNLECKLIPDNNKYVAILFSFWIAIGKRALA